MPMGLGPEPDRAAVAGRKRRSWWENSVAVVILVSTLGRCAVAIEPPASDDQPLVDFSRDVRPILSDHCLACHGFDPTSRQADLRLDTLDGALHSGSGQVVVPFEPDSSLLIERIFADERDLVMPPPEHHKPLTPQQKQTLRRWIAEGAEYRDHWAFLPLTAELPPSVSPSVSQSAAKHPIDRFIRAPLTDQGLQPAPPAPPHTQLRRISLDLTGLPPSPADLQRFSAAWQLDPDRAYFEAVDRLLASPAYGERFGRWWLDQARYADSHGYSIDAPREMWLYRDWVIRSLNADLPFDRFTVEQLAGDLLPDAGESQRVATGFHRNTQINQEGGIDKEQFRIESVFDRVATTGTVWLGLSVGCAQCHDHKFDPISQLDYYRLFAIFNNQDEPALKVELAAGQTVSALVLAERAEPRESHLLIKGDFTRPAERVAPGGLHALPPMVPRGEQIDRLDLANWLVDGRNPLVARVLVNRLWLQFFGRGLVETEDDFGLQGASPSHPQLLDWLAAELQRRQWRIKDLVRLIVTSGTYRQSSMLTADGTERDPYNVWFARQTRLRLDAELVRDAALLASGQLALQVGGPPVFPPIPEGVMAQGQVKRAWTESPGADRYRRGLYTFRFRATPPPSLSVFDAPDGVSSCTRRLRSNTPLQALTLMNDRGFFELAEALAGVIDTEGLQAAFVRCTSRIPSDRELEVLQRLDRLTAARVLLNLDETYNRE
jgi:hypothetical protein